MSDLVDLHLHSIFSDGTLSPTELVQAAARQGLKAMALSDHDSTAGIDEAVAAGSTFGVEVIPAVELSVEFKGYRDIHLLGYFIRHHDGPFQERLRVFQERRELRMKEILDKVNRKLLRENHSLLSYEEVSALAAGTIGRPHIAQALIARGIVSTVQEGFLRYLVPLDVPRKYIPMLEAIGEIHRLEGVAVLAHPLTITEDRKLLMVLLRDLARNGLDGIEAFSGSCSREESSFLEGVAYRLGLVKTGGSDFHGMDGEIAIGTGRGNLSVPYAVVDELKRVRKRLLFE